MAENQIPKLVSMSNLSTGRCFALLFAFLLLTIQVSGAESLRDPNKLWEAKVEQVQRVTSARVLLADYELIRRDFPEIKTFSNEQIDQWLIDNTAFVSLQQAAQTEVNDPIPQKSEYRAAYRPREYRRAHVFIASTGGLIDAKGTGAVDPSGGSHDNGLATLGDMIREYMYEKLVHAIFVKDRRFDTVGSYAVIDFGFKIKHPDGGKSRAGIILRQAHARYHEGPIGNFRGRSQSAMLPRPLQLEIESLLRRFGITSSVQYANKDLINLQGAESGAVVDFGSFLVQEKFSRNVSYFYDDLGNPNIDPKNFIMSSQAENFIQPRPELQIPFNIWGYSQSKKEDSKYDNPYIWSHELAESLANGTASRQDAEQHLRNFFDTHSVQNVLRSIPPACRRVYQLEI